MAQIQYTDLVQDVLPHLAADPSDPVTENAIKRTVIEFCAGSWIWKSFQDPVTVLPGVNTYDLEPETGTDVSAVLAVELDGRPLNARDVPWLNRELPRWKTVAGTIKYFTQIDTETLILAPLPDSQITNALTITLALQPSQKATSLPSWIYNLYIYALVDGAVSRLMLMPNKGWSDAAAGLDRRTKFEAAMANARNNAVSALGIAPQRSKSQH